MVMGITELNTIVGEMDRLLKTATVKDWPGAYNGLQVENSGRVKKIAAAVDANESSIRAAGECGASLLIVHHGLFWNKPLPLVGAAYRKMKLCMELDLAVYSSHLPLDLHATLGNNILLCRALGLKKTSPFFEAHGQAIGRLATASLPRNRLMEQLKKVVGGPVHLIAGGPTSLRKICVVTGAVGDPTPIVDAGVDTLITGEGSHWTHGWAHENGVNILYAGHYATETFGVNALAAAMARKYRLPWAFLADPSGL